MGEKWLQEFLPVLKKNPKCKKFLDSVYFRAISPPCLFSNHLKWKVHSIPLPDIFQHHGFGFQLLLAKTLSIRVWQIENQKSVFSGTRYWPLCSGASFHVLWRRMMIRRKRGVGKIQTVAVSPCMVKIVATWTHWSLKVILIPVKKTSKFKPSCLLHSKINWHI